MKSLFQSKKGKLISCLLAGCFLFGTACNDSVPEPNASDNSIIGLWSISSANVARYVNGGWIGGGGNNDHSGTIEFRPSGWGSMNFNFNVFSIPTKWEEEFSWISNDSLILINQDFSNPDKWNRVSNSLNVQSFQIRNEENDSTEVIFTIGFNRID